MVLADFTGDGQLDVITVNISSDDLSFLVGLGDGTFVRQDKIRVGESPNHIVAGDFNGDDFLDLAVSHDVSNDLWLLQGNEDGTFGLVEEDVLKFNLLSEAQDLVAGDLGGDKSDDLIVPHSNGRITIFYGDETTPFDDKDTLTVLLNVALSGEPEDLQPLKLESVAIPPVEFRETVGDRKIVNFFVGPVKGKLHDKVVIFRRQDDGSFKQAPASQLVSVGIKPDKNDSPQMVVLADFNRDGIVDLATPNDKSNTVSIRLGLKLDDPTKSPLFDNVGQNLAAGDVDGDGQTDFIIVDKSRDEFRIELSDADADFVQGSDDGILSPGGVEVADLNGDGFDDIIVPNGGGNNVLVYLGSEGGKFATAQSFITGTNPVHVSIHNLNPADDDLLDLVVTNKGSDDLTASGQKTEMAQCSLIIEI